MKTNHTNPIFIKEESPTWGVIIVVYGGWALLCAHYPTLPAYLAIPALTFLLTLHSSLCHELIHGHPTRVQQINDLLGLAPLSLLYPYTIFKMTHLKHHNDAQITLPGIDPESFFYSPKQWAAQSRTGKKIAWIRMTLAGRLLLGPGLTAIDLGQQAIRAIRQRTAERATWVLHIVLVPTVLVIATQWFTVPLWEYLLCAYASQSMIMLRSFYEHRAVTSVSERTVLQEACLPLRFLYLNNNYHLVHHRYPTLPWYRIPNEYRRHQKAYLAKNNHYRFKGYSAWLQYLFKPVASPIHPFHVD